MNRPAPNGFTLIETLIVMTILAILASVVLPAMQTEETQTLEATALRVVSDLRLARSLAIQQGIDYTVRFDREAGTYEMFPESSALESGNRLPLQSAQNSQVNTTQFELNPRGVKLLAGGEYRFAAIRLQDSGTDINDVTFGPLGGTGPKRNQDTIIWLTNQSGSGGSFYRLTISWLTGLVWLDGPLTVGPNSPSSATVRQIPANG